ncbi:type II toxin-antitoxin system RelE/ParE family toxin [Methyloversatilis sp.]|uniref:type II toxin-antitoxin system RelE/ParE family toxin n=1 Tax=Methyloversatilis sp. TaxID=2569862 RepID=UPI0027374514|nr:type II toxin-antitoxin system RelE/ParE family toxin [Methyloversatilis sp.]MDP3453837.1 type II toxin-antitoxin system RelE/ParE family toxin [Methyloversatilis sp.]MDP3578706.1 type II toxin-antitoxin system RelE/ParE family toxin [Methyloversatilis sp.]
MGEHAWTVRLSAAAETDYRHILRWTTQNFGSAQARTYADTLSLALQALIAGPDAIGVRERPEIGIGIRSLHVARNGRKGRHFVMFRIASNQNSTVIDVLRLLHDSMDLERYGPFTESD